jgi:glycosyltransferase involved in cell wall biosynthesis
MINVTVEKSSVTVGIPTRNRYDSLAHTIMSIAMQTVKPKEIIVVDDSDIAVDLRTISMYKYIFEILQNKGIEWKVIFGQKRGQHYSHQTVQDISSGKFIFRIDDDEIAEPDVIENLISSMTENVGAVAPLILMPSCNENLPIGLDNNIITDLSKPNIQWFKWIGEKKVEHLHSCFLYRKGISKYELSLSQKAFREETLFTHSIYRMGYELIVNANAVVWHFKAEKGGIRL